MGKDDGQALHRATLVAWAAGLFEGEGCIAPIRMRRRGRVTAALIVTSTDLDVLERFREIVECGKIRPVSRHYKPNQKQLYEWRIYNRDAVWEVLVMLWPWLCSRRQQRVLEVMSEVTPLTRSGYVG